MGTTIKTLTCTVACSMTLLLISALALAQSAGASDSDRLNDFIEYWAAARLLLAGGNPYSPEALLDLQRSLGWPSPLPLIMWNPPWTLSLLLPFAVTEFPVSQLAWLLLHTSLLFFAAARLWQIYGAEVDYRFPLLLALSFVPADIAVIAGQIGPLMLLGIVGFLYFERRGAWFAAGASTALVSVKPHLLYLFWFALLLWVVKRKCWALVWGALGAGMTLALIPLLMNPAVYSDYLKLWHTTTVPTPYDWEAPTLGYLLKIVFNIADGRILYLPSAIGALWFLSYWRRHKDDWNWAEQMPLLLLVSLTTAAYAWSFDQVVLLPAVIQGAAWIIARKVKHSITATALYASINVLYLSMMVLVGKEFWYFSMVPALLGIYLFLRRSNLGKSPRLPMVTVGS